MSLDWCRLWHDMPTDPKFRAVAKRAGRPLSEVITIFTAMLVNASANDDARGTLRNWSHEDMGAAFDVEPEHVQAIHTAMQGKLLDGDRLTGWERRQPKREDGSAERAKAFRERNRTQPNATDHGQTQTTSRLEQDTDTDTDKAAPLPPEQAARSRQQVNKLVLKGAGVRLTAEVRELTRKRAEGLGLPVEAILAETAESKPDNADAYFRAICRRRLKIILPGLSDDLASAAFERDGKAFASLCSLLTMGAMQ